MGRRIIALAALGVALLMSPALVVAHHGAATFDTVGEITIKGTVTEWVWSNPHSILRLEVRSADGTVKTWSGGMRTRCGPGLAGRFLRPMNGSGTFLDLLKTTCQRRHLAM